MNHGSKRTQLSILMSQREALLEMKSRTLDELVGLYLISMLTDHVTNGSVSVYRDDGLAAIQNYSRPEVDKKLEKDYIYFHEY